MILINELLLGGSAGVPDMELHLVVVQCAFISFTFYNIDLYKKSK